MVENKIIERFKVIKIFLLCAFAVIIAKMVYMNVVQHEYYTSLAENKTYKEVTIKAARGEIRDRYGRLLAGNTNSFVVQVSSDQLTSKDNDANSIALKIMNKLIENGEEYEDNFPIVIDENGNFSYTYDKNVSDYKEKNNIPSNLNAKETFYYLVDSLIEDGTLKESDRNLNRGELQKKLNSKGYYPPILVTNFEFTEIKNKNDWLESFVKKLDDGTKLKTDGVFVAQGVAGSTDFARKIGALVKNEKIVVNEKMQTTVKGLYACGDCIGGTLQVAKAVNDGMIAGIDIIKNI